MLTKPLRNFPTWSQTHITSTMSFRCRGAGTATERAAKYSRTRGRGLAPSVHKTSQKETPARNQTRHLNDSFKFWSTGTATKTCDKPGNIWNEDLHGLFTTSSRNKLPVRRQHHASRYLSEPDAPQSQTFGLAQSAHKPSKTKPTSTSPSKI